METRSSRSVFFDPAVVRNPSLPSVSNSNHRLRFPSPSSVPITVPRLRHRARLRHCPRTRRRSSLFHLSVGLVGILIPLGFLPITLYLTRFLLHKHTSPLAQQVHRCPSLHRCRSKLTAVALSIAPVSKEQLNNVIMGGKQWAADEEAYFWLKVMPRSPQRLVQSDPETSWGELAAEMNRVFGENRRREYTLLCLCEYHPLSFTILLSFGSTF